MTGRAGALPEQGINVQECMIDQSVIKREMPRPGRKIDVPRSYHRSDNVQKNGDEKRKKRKEKEKDRGVILAIMN